MKYLGQIVDDKDLVNKEYVDDASEVVQTLTSGTKIGSVGGTDLYAPTGSGSVLDAYPVGSIYMSVNNTDPGTLFGGSWTQIQNRFLFSAGSFHSAGDEGGSRYIQAHKHSFTGSSHSHDAGSKQAFVRYNYGSISTGISERSVASGASGNYKAPVVNSANVDFSYLQNTSSETAGGTVGDVTGATTGLSGSTAEGNMPPYLTVYMWKRTA